MARASRWLILSWLCLAAFPAGACPVCDSPAGREVREGIFNERFVRNAAMTLAPFPVFAVGVAWIFRGGRRNASIDCERNH